MTFVLEYSEAQRCFHNNYKNPSGEFDHPLFSNGYLPITLLEDEAFIEDEALGAEMEGICKDGLSYKEAAKRILFYLCSL